jgi:hypothetical protein
LLQAGEYAEAVARIKEVRKSCQNAFGSNSLATLDAQVLLGIALRSAGHPVEAEPEFLGALSLLTRRFGETHNDTLACRLSHSTNLLSLDRYADAEDGIRDVLAAYERRGAAHPHALVCRVNLASALRLRSQQTQAMETIGPALADLQSTLGPQRAQAHARARPTAVLRSGSLE